MSHNYKCDVGLMIDCDVAEKRYENKVGMSSYKSLNTHWPLITSFNAPPSDHAQRPHLLATHTDHTHSHNFQPYIIVFAKI